MIGRGCVACVAAGADAGLPRLDGVPQILIDDPQLRHLLDHPFGFRIRTGLALASIGILDEALAVPHQFSDIHLIVEDAGAARPVAIDGREVSGIMRGDGGIDWSFARKRGLGL
ncbi:hypothetical protein GLUCORHAEAF1_09790 [Komagataeibacter rhaeticus AF1]|nr:hypothetical protein GLUCORHAEAF1_09790 [Komagataeibacter rhaeticus AF1]